MTAKTGKKIMNMGLAGLLAIGGVSLATLPSQAATSAKTNGCYLEWSAKYRWAKYNPAKATGNYRPYVARANQPDHTGPWRWIGKGSRVTFDEGGSIRGVQGGSIQYSGS